MLFTKNREADPRIQTGLRIAEEATKAAQETIRASFEREEERAREREKELREQQESEQDPKVKKQLAAEIKDLRRRRETRKTELEKAAGTLEKTAEAVAKLRERKRS